MVKGEADQAAELETSCTGLPMQLEQQQEPFLLLVDREAQPRVWLLKQVLLSR